MKDSPKVTRRQFLKASGTGLLGSVFLSQCHPHEDPFALQKPPVPGEEKWKRFQEASLVTSCAQCAAGCGIRVRVVEGHAVKIEGASDNPINRGGIGPRGLAGLQVLYDPDRIQQPLRRKGARGSGDWEPVSWESAMSEVAERLRKLREQKKSHQLGILCGRDRGMMYKLWQRFSRAYGTSNFFDTTSRSINAIVQSSYLMQGTQEIPAYDWESTRYVVGFGADILESSCQMVYFSRAAAHLRHGRAGIRAKILAVEPSLSRTAANADEWISIAEGTYAAFALGLAHVLVKEEAYDKEFIQNHSFGFDNWVDGTKKNHQGFRELLLSEYTPEKVAEVCKVPSETLVRIGRELAKERPAFAIPGYRATLASNGLHVAMAVSALNALLGAIDRPGGVLTQRPAPLTPWPDVSLDGTAKQGLEMPRLDCAETKQLSSGGSATESLPEAILNQKPYCLDTLFLYYANPVYSGIAPKRWQEALSKVPFIVTFSPFMDETSHEVADLILPDHTYLERWEDAATAPSVGYPIFGIRRPVVKPLYDTRATGDVLLEITRQVEDIQGAFPWKDTEALLRNMTHGLYASKRGSIVQSEEKDFFKELLQKGFWSDEGYPFERWSEVLKTPSGKFEFFPQKMFKQLTRFAEENRTNVQKVLSRFGYSQSPNTFCMPSYTPLQWMGDPVEFPFVLEPYKPGTYAEGSGANLPLLQELVTDSGREPWITQVEISQETARQLRVRNGDIVQVESAQSSVRAPAHICKGLRPETVRIPRGGGHSALGRFAKGWGVNVMQLLVPSSNLLGGIALIHGTRVKIKKVEA